MANTNRATALHAAIGSSVFAAPTTGNHKAALSVLQNAGVLTASGAYAGGKGIADVERMLVPSIPGEILARAVGVLGY